MVRGKFGFGAAAAWLALATSGAAADKAAPSLGVYGSLPGVEDMAISPGGAGIAVVGIIENERRLAIIGADQKIKAMIPMGMTKLSYVDWAGEDRVLVATHKTEPLGIGFTEDKHEFTNVIVVPTDGSKLRVVFGDKAAMAHAIFGSYGVRQVAGRSLGFFAGIELKRGAALNDYIFDGSNPALMSVDLASNKTHLVSAGPAENHWRDWLVDGQGVVRVLLDVSQTSGEWKISVPGSGLLATGKDAHGDISLLSFGKDGSSVIYSVLDRQENATRWFEVPLAGGTPQEILANIDIKRIYIDPANGRMQGYLEDGAPPKPVLYDPANQAAVQRIYRSFGKLHVSIVQWTPGFGHVLIHTSGNGDSGTWYLIDMAGLKADMVGFDYPLIEPADVGPISEVTYKAADGLTMSGILTLPPGRSPKNLPVVIMPHGGPQAHDEAGFDWWAQAFASRGYAVFQPNFRGSTDRDVAFVRAGYGQWGRRMQTDLSDGLAELAKQGIVDAKRACIVGASYGGYAALAGVTLWHGIYRCSVAVAPVTDLADMYWTDYHESGDNEMLKRNLKESLGDPSTFAAVSPRKHAGDAEAPIMLIHGKDDTVVAYRQSTGMAEALQQKGKPYELVTMPGEDHWLSRSETRKQMLEAAMRWVTKYNPAD